MTRRTPDLHERVARLEDEVAEFRALVDCRKSGSVGRTVFAVTIASGFVALVVFFTG